VRPQPESVTVQADSICPAGRRPREFVPGIDEAGEIRILERLTGGAVNEIRGGYATNRSTNRPLHQGHGQGIC